MKENAQNTENGKTSGKFILKKCENTVWPNIFIIESLKCSTQTWFYRKISPVFSLET